MLFPGQGLEAGSCYYHLDMQSDGNLVTYGGGYKGFAAEWSSNTQNTGGYAVMQADGNFVIYNWADAAVWSTDTYGQATTGYLAQQDDGNLVLYRQFQSNNVWYTQAIWASNVQTSKQFGTCNPAHEKQTHVVSDHDMPGNDYRTLIPNQARASWCGYFCSQDSQCKGYTYVPPNSGQGASPICHLKNATSALTSHTGFVSGLISTD